jgi:predicted DNA-binding protein (UPF0251 family)
MIKNRIDNQGRARRGRPRIKRVVNQSPRVDYFKPRGIPIGQLNVMNLSLEEIEALRLADVEDLDQKKAAKVMKVSRPTFQRVLASARRKTAQALVYGQAIKMKGGDFYMATPVGRGRGRGAGLGQGRGAVAPGQGRGRMGGAFAAGPGGVCVCTNSDCKHEEPHVVGKACYEMKCSKCGAAMIRKR